jgi:hypothetical protein
MPERVYMNRIPGQERIHVAFLAAEIPDLLEDLYESSLGRNPATETLRLILENAREQFTPKEPAPKFQCDGFHWIGQPFSTCDNCGVPAWFHAGMHVYPSGSGPFATDPGRTEPWKPGEAEAMKAKFEAARASALARSKEQ